MPGPVIALVELLVVIAIIGVLVTRLLPAVQAVRRAAARTERLNWKSQRTLGEQPPRTAPYQVLFVGNNHSYIYDVPGLVLDTAKAARKADVRVMRV